MNTWTIDDAAHLLRRAGFGGSVADVEALHGMGREGAIDYLVDYEAIEDDAGSGADAAVGAIDSGGAAIHWALYRMAYSTRPLQEKLTWFWHGHFTSALSKCPPPLMVIQNETWRAHAKTHFVEFLKTMYKDPAMLRYLDNDTNVKDAPNENFARELMELFTIGIGHYTETDVQEAARALTGWRIGRRGGAILGVFDPEAHDFGQKTFLGVPGNLGGDDVMEILADHPQTPRFICTKLFRHFVHPNPTDQEIAPLVDAWKASGGHIHAVLHELFRLDAFWGETARQGLVKSPVEFLLGLVQRWGLDDPQQLRFLGVGLNAMGQTPLNPPHVAGYPENLEWAATSPLLARYNTVNQVVYSRRSSAIVREMTAGADVSNADALIDTLLQRMGPLRTTEPTRQALVGYMEPATYQASAREVALKVRGVLHLIASTPEFQLN